MPLSFLCAAAFAAVLAAVLTISAVGLLANAPPFSGLGVASLFLILYGCGLRFCCEPAVFLPAFLILCVAFFAAPFRAEPKPVEGLLLNCFYFQDCIEHCLLRKFSMSNQLAFHCCVLSMKDANASGY